MRRFLALTLALATALSSTGCSFAFTSGPQSSGSPPREYPECTSWMTWPAVDGILGGLFLALGFAYGFEKEHFINDPPAEAANDHTNSAYASAFISGVFVASAVVGYWRVSRCQKARERFLAAHPGYNPQDPYPGQYPYPAEPYSPPQPYPSPQQPYSPAPPQQPYPPAPPQQTYPPVPPAPPAPPPPAA